MAEDIIIRYRAEVDDLKRELNEVIAQQEKLQKSLGKTDEEFEDTAKSADKLGDELDDISKKGKNFDKVTTSAKKADKVFTTLGKTLAKVGLAIAAAVGTRALIDFSSASLRAAADFETLKVSFATFLGSAKEAEKVLADLDKFSLKTPFSPEQVQDAGKALLAFGIESKKLIPTLQRIGDVSAATGKDFNELAVIYGKARTQGVLFAEDINQLTEAGVPIIAELAEQFGVAEGQVKKLGSQGKITFENLEEGFKSLTSEGGKFFNLTAELSTTTSGKLSTLEGNITQLKRSFGAALQGPFNRFLDLLNGVNTDLEEANKSFRETSAAIRSFDDNIVPLIARYDELNEKTNLSTEEQTELESIIQQIAETVPTAITQFDEYGNALDINSEKAKSFREELILLNEQKNKDALKEVREEIALVTKEVEIAVAALSRRDSEGSLVKLVTTQDLKTGREFREEVALTNEEIRDRQAALKVVQDELKGLQLLERELRGEPLFDEDEFEQPTLDIKKFSGSTQDAVKGVKELQKELKELGETRLDFTGEFARAKADGDRILGGGITELTNKLAEDIQKLTLKTGQSLEQSTAIVLTKNKILVDGYVADLVRSQVATGTLIEGLVSKTTSATSDIIEKEQRKGREAAIDASIQLFNELSSLSAIFTDNRIADLDRELDAVRDRTSQELSLLEDSRESRLITESEFQAQRQALQEKELALEQALIAEKNKLARRQALIDKANAVFQISINTEQAISRALAEYPFPFSTVVAGIVGALAAASLAATIAAPIPKFAKGTKGKKGSGMALVGEEGPEMTYLHSGSKVLPAKQTKRYSEVFDAMYDNDFDGYVVKNFVTPALLAQKEKHKEQQNQTFASNIVNSMQGVTYYDLEASRKKGMNVNNIEDFARIVAKSMEVNTRRL